MYLNGGAEAIAYMSSYSSFSWGNAQSADLTSGDLLDNGEQHFGGPDEGAWFATKSWEAIDSLLSGHHATASARTFVRPPAVFIDTEESEELL